MSSLESYPLLTYNYRVSLEKYDFRFSSASTYAVLKSDNVITMSFSEVTGLSEEYNRVDYEHGLSFLTGKQIMRGRKNPIIITLKRGIISDDTDKNYLYDWFNGDLFSSNWLDRFGGRKKRVIYIDLCDPTGNVIITWTVKGALPLKWEAPDFNADDNSVAIESVELTAHQIKTTYH